MASLRFAVQVTWPSGSVKNYVIDGSLDPAAEADKFVRLAAARGIQVSAEVIGLRRTGDFMRDLRRA